MQGEGRYLDPIYDALTSTLNAVTASDPIRAGGPNVVGPLESGVRSVAQADAEGITVTGLENGQIVLLKLIDGSFQISNAFVAHRGSVRSVVTIPSTGQIVSAGDDGLVKIWTGNTDGDLRSEELTRYDGSALALAVSNDGSLVASGSSEGELIVWDVQSRSRVYEQVLPVASSIRSIAFRNRDNTLAYGSDDGKIRMLDTEGNPVHEWDAEQGRIQALAFHPTDELLASGGDESYVRRWRLNDTANPLAADDILRGHEGPVSAIAFNVSGTRMASGSYDHSLQIWDLTEPTANSIILQSHTAWVKALAFVRSGNQIVSVGADRTVQIWNLDLEELASKVCSVISNTDLTRPEWDQYVGSDFAYASDYKPCSRTAQAEANKP